VLMIIFLQVKIVGSFLIQINLFRGIDHFKTEQNGEK
jgi:hypothetical protein